MKKIILTALLLLAAVSVSCYDASQNATVRINLGNMPVAFDAQGSLFDSVLHLFEKNAYAASPGVFRVHVAVFSDGGLTAAQSFEVTAELPRDSVELSVPAGNRVNILVAGEHNDGNGYISGKYFGYITADLKPGETSNVTVKVYNLTTTQPESGLTWAEIIGLDVNGTYDLLYWNSPGFPVKFHVYNNEWNGETYVEVPVYDGDGLSVPISGGYWFSLYIEFVPFGVRSEKIEINFG